MKTLPLNAAEADVQAAILVAVTALPGVFAWRQNTGLFRSMDGKRVVRAAIPGCPDIIAIYRGRFVGIEVKRATGKQRDEQMNFERLLTRAGGIYAICRGPSEALDVLAAIGAEAVA